ncbi:MAG: TetR/AcrR family transcriptional regulator [Sphaerochaetaceae bacterium]|nr:TetR/AcrR family transcriptional regulator [Sphaerochaetaceae bacterium]
MATKKLNRQQIIEITKDISIHKTNSLASMREIASKLNVSVGTLYNYYDNQESLWCDVFNKMWESTEKSIKNILNQEIPNADKMEKMIKLISSDIKKRNGYGYKLFNKIGNNLAYKQIKLFDVRKFLKESFLEVISGTDNQKQVKINIITTLLLNGSIDQDSKLLNEYINLLK